MVSNMFGIVSLLLLYSVKVQGYDGAVNGMVMTWFEACLYCIVMKNIQLGVARDFVTFACR